MVESCRNESLPVTLQKAVEILRVAQDTIERSHAARSPRGLISGTLYHLAFEHAASILLLVHESHNGSALALLRPAYDALLRGVWLAYGASDACIERLVQDGSKFLDNKSMTTAVGARAPEELRAVISGLHEALPAKYRHDFTHGGIFQVSQRFSAVAIGSNFSEELLVILVQSAGLLLAGSAIGVADLTEGDEGYINAVNSLTAAIQDHLG